MTEQASNERAAAGPSGPAGGAGAAQATGTATARLVSYGLIAAGAVALFVVAGDLPASRWEPLGAGSFPQIVLGLLALVAVFAFVGEWRSRPSPEAKPVDLIAVLVRYRMVAALLAAFAAYVALLQAVGFSIASFGFLLVSQLLLGPKSPKAIALMVVIALVFSFGLNALFANVFNVFLPRARGFG